MSETAIGSLTAAELTPEHYGCLVVWEQTTEWGTVMREVVCDELRRWVYDGERRVEITDFTPHGAAIGSSHTIAGSTPVGIGRRIRKARRRRWSKQPLQEWAELDHDPRCISLTHSAFNEHCDCAMLRMIDAHRSTERQENR